MKRLILSIYFVLGLLASANAQKSGNFQFGVQAGLNLSTLTGDESAEVNTKPGFNVGVTTDYFFSEYIYIESGLSLSLKGAKINLEVLDLDMEQFIEMPATVELKLNMYYLELPILAAYRSYLSDNFKLDFLVGPYVAFGVGGNLKFHSKGGGDLLADVCDVVENRMNESIDVFGDKGVYHRFDFGLKFGVKANINNFYVTAGYELGLINIEKEIEEIKGFENFVSDSDSEVEEMSTVETKTGNFFVGIGYVF